jgi:predicted phage terminase large subunit-like protein
MNRDIEDFRSQLKKHLILFIEASFGELNPETDLVMNWHIELIARALEDCFTGKIKRLIINVPPRSLKSHCVSIAFVAWLLGHRPNAKVIAASYAQDLSDKLARDCRQLMASEFYQNLFQTRLSSSKAAVNEFETTSGGYRVSTSAGGPMTGRGADFIIIDDPLKSDDGLSDARRKSTNEWFDSTVPTRLNSKVDGCIILIMQRLHEDDLAGHLLDSGDWVHLNFPAIAEKDEEYQIEHPLLGSRTVRRREGDLLHPDREPLHVLEAMKKTLGSYNFAGQYQQAPAPHGGGMVKTEWFRRYTEAEKPEKFSFIFQSWDTASTQTTFSDYSVCTTWGIHKGNFYLLHVLRKRMEFPELKRTVLLQANAFTVRNILIEDKASGIQLIQELRAQGLIGVSAYKSDQHKAVRMNSVTLTLEQGCVFLPAGAPWLEDFLHELSLFPNGKHDDQADSMSQALDWYKNKFNRWNPVMEMYARDLARRRGEDYEHYSVFNADYKFD